jgi:hypothetical protein
MTSVRVAALPQQLTLIIIVLSSVAGLPAVETELVEIAPGTATPLLSMVSEMLPAAVGDAVVETLTR